METKLSQNGKEMADLSAAFGSLHSGILGNDYFEGFFTEINILFFLSNNFFFFNELLVVMGLRINLLYIKDYFSFGKRSISIPTTFPSLPFQTAPCRYCPKSGEVSGEL